MPRLTAAANNINPCQPGVDDLLGRLKSEEAKAARIAVAYSGGADSTALLHAMQCRAPQNLLAVHVHHGLQAAADQFAQHCRVQCEALGIALQVVHVDARASIGESPEDAARKARYKALAEACIAQGITHMVLAQHADDQVETLMLALSRGAGLPGLAAMPARFQRFGVEFHRPILAVPADHIRQWLVQKAIPFVVDPSNVDEQYTRNRIRRRVLPALELAFPGFRASFARSAKHAAQGKRLLESLAQIDLVQVGSPPAIAALQVLPTERQANALRYWLQSVHQTVGSDAQLTELIKQIKACTSRGHRIHIKLGAGHVTRAGGALAYLP